MNGGVEADADACAVCTGTFLPRDDVTSVDGRRVHLRCDPRAVGWVRCKSQKDGRRCVDTLGHLGDHGTADVRWSS